MDEACLTDHNATILFLDTEGFFSPNVTDTYDAKMFAIATLLSSEVIYNTVKFIDNQQVELLELLIRRTNLFGLRAYARHTYHGSRDATSESSNIEQTPSPVSNLSAYLRVLVPSRLSWVVQDFVQDLQGLQPEEWLRELITQDRNVTTSVGTFFKEIDCVPLPVPAGDSETLQKLDKVDPRDLDKSYIKEMNAFRSRLYRRATLHPKVKGGSKVAEGGDLAIAPMSGEDLADLLEFLVDAANIGSVEEQKDGEPFPQLPSIAEQFTSLQLRLMKSDILNILERDLVAIIDTAYKHGTPLKRNAFAQEVSMAEQQAVALWNSTVKGFVSSQDLFSEVSAAERDFSDGLMIVRNRTATRNCNLVATWCQEYARNLLDLLESGLNTETPTAQVPSQLESLLIEHIDGVRVRFQRVGGSEFQMDWSYDGGPSCCRVTMSEFDGGIKNITTHIKYRNNRMVEEEFESVAEGLIRGFKSRITKKKEDDDLLQKEKAYVDRFFEIEKKSLLKDYEEALYRYRSMPLMATKSKLFSRALEAIISQFVKEWGQRCYEQAEVSLSFADCVW
eukprot:Blabericola_migrator_1__1206@NODE_1309_length_4841_cov_86_500628_g881_i0_p1_GENE_NODE_1309_length_4841_cov_86_500628_g881_i0NODE_1309_length_4841_cov_86_500628_g881_i0_p1_ORF_typecomplete_len562_score95_10GBP/PF02263_19/3_4e29_NODE_1309_length_4841_cov_86_500628_g881_i02651950